MEFKDMKMSDVEARMTQIKEELNAPEADIDALTAEVESLEARKAEIEAEVEQRKAEEQNVLENNKVVETIKITEDKKMERTFSVDSAEYRDAWLKNLMGKELDAEEKRAMTATAAIPTETLNKIVVVLKENPLLSRIDLLQIPGYVRIPVYSTNLSASWTETSTDSADALTYIDLTPYQLIKTVEVPGTVDKMSISAFESYLVEALANKIEEALQTAVLVGSGSSQATGIITTKTTADGTFTKAAATKKDLLTIMGKLDSAYQRGACWIMPASVFFGEVMNISTHDSFVNVNEGFNYKLFGKDVIMDDNCTVSSVDNILYGQPKAYHMNLGEGVTVDKDASVGFRSNSVVYRGVCLADGKLDSSDAFVRYTRATA